MALQYPVELNKPDRLVYTPHAYGKSVYVQPYTSDPSYPRNLAAIWDRNFGFVRSAGGPPLVIGEWGGLLPFDVDYYEALVEYLIARYEHMSAFMPLLFSPQLCCQF